MKNGPTKPKNKIVGIIQTILIVFTTIFSIASIAISSTIIFHNVYYKTFWVNGQSMYPTLNANAKRSNGTLIGNNASRKEDPSASENDYDIDYGYMDVQKSVIDNLDRFDIVVIKLHPEDEHSKRLIKRLIVKPGETFYIQNTGPNNEDNGKLYIKDGEEPIEGTDQTKPKWKYVEQNFIDYDSIIKCGNYRCSFSDDCNNPDKGYTLAEDEYFVMGDNRFPGCSSDSRNISEEEGQYKRSQIEGKAIALEGTCTVIINEKGKLDAGKIKYHWPTRL